MKTINHSATIGIFISESADLLVVSLHNILFTDSMKIVHYSLTRGMTHKKLFWYFRIQGPHPSTGARMSAHGSADSDIKIPLVVE